MFFSTLHSGASVLNFWFDEWFYDVASLSPEESAALPSLRAEGWFLWVPPAGQPGLQAYRSVAEMPQPPRIFTVAGSVASCRGAAALARNVADAYGQPVCAVVSAEQAGWAQGWSACSQWTEAWCNLALACWGLNPTPPSARVRSGSELLLEILNDESLAVDVLVGHSQGSLTLATALAHCERSDLNPAIVTLGGVVDVPARFQHVQQYLGSLDLLGRLNSRLHLAHVSVPNAAHHLNTRWVFHCDAQQLVKSA